MSKSALPVVVPGDMAGAAVHARIWSAGIVGHDALPDVDEVDLADRLRLDDVVEVEAEQLDDAGDVAAVANLKKKLMQ